MKDPLPAEPSPAEPSPAEPSPAEPLPAEPLPAEPSPAEPSPAEPSPAEPLTALGSKNGGNRKRWRLVGAAVLVVGAIATGVALYQRGVEANRNAPVALQLTASEQQAVLEHTRALVLGKAAPALPRAATKLCRRHVFVELFRNHRRNYAFGVAEASERPRLCLPEALSSAVRDLKSNDGFEKHWASALDSTRLGISISGPDQWPVRIVYANAGEGDAKNVGRAGWRLHTRDFEMGRDGLVLLPVRETHAASDAPPNSAPPVTFAPPMEALVRQHGLEDNRVQLRRFSKTQFERAGIPRSADKEQKPALRAIAFRTAAFLERAPGSKEPPWNPIRGNVPYGRVDADELYQLATRLTNYLLGAMDGDGRFDYEYYANTDRSSPSYNIVRHAGATYSILLTHNYTGDVEYLDAGLRAKDYMVERLTDQAYEPLPYHGKPGSVRVPFPEADGSIRLLALEENRKATLGATALAILAFTQIPRGELTPEDATRLKHMVNFCWYLQCESGGFYATYAQAKQGQCPDVQPKYYPGETLLALNSLYRVDANPAYLAIAEKSVGFELERVRNGDWPDHWVMQALDLMEQNMPERARDERWPDAALGMANQYIAGQYMVDRDYARRAPAPELEGGYEASGGPPRNTPTGSRSEAVAGVYRLMKRLGRRDDAQRLGDSLLAAAHFLAQEVFRPENTYFLPDPAQALWGLRGSMIDQSVRIDYNQHALVGVWGAWEVAVDRGGIGWPPPEGAEGDELQTQAEQGKLITRKGTWRPWRAKPTHPAPSATSMAP